MTVSQPLIAEWSTPDKTKRVEVKSWQEAQALVHDIASQTEQPCLVEFYGSDSDQSLGLGVGREMTVVTYQDSLDPPYFISLGDEERRGTEWFCYGNEQTEYCATNLVPMAQGMAALKHFVEHRSQPVNLVWERL